MKLWTPREEALLLLNATMQRAGVCRRFAQATNRSVRSVRIKLCRLEKDPVNRAPVLAPQPDAAAPRVQPARGPDSTPDSEA
ncbi:hypothetical protein [Reyranella sp.]|uniref:hypothetical protein n=1 Tax=Reyranella sp. TaxID=1929291 RepID=UPI003D0D2B99